MAGLCDEDLVELSLDDIKNSCGFGLDIGNYEVVYSKEVMHPAGRALTSGRTYFGLTSELTLELTDWSVNSFLVLL